MRKVIANRHMEWHREQNSGNVSLMLEGGGAVKVPDLSSEQFAALFQTLNQEGPVYLDQDGVVGSDDLENAPTFRFVFPPSYTVISG